MWYRRSANIDVASSRWRLANQSLLEACGIPHEVASADRRWIYVLLHGDDHLGTGWDVSWISPSQAANLLAAFECDLQSTVGLDLVQLLRKRCAPNM
jgi:hypothetical protein